MNPRKPPAPRINPRRVLGLFAKRPEPGQVKPRLAEAKSPEWAARVAAALLKDSLHRLTPFPSRRVLVYSPADAADYFTELARGRFETVPQGDGDLGARMAGFMAAQLAAGAQAVVLVGADSPTLPLVNIAKAFHWLSGHADVVLGPAADGGAYLIGCAGQVPPLFEGVAWGSSRVLADLVARLSEPAWRLGMLPPWHDVDTPDDWQMLRGYVAAMKRATLPLDLPNSAALCDED